MHIQAIHTHIQVHIKALYPADTIPVCAWALVLSARAHICAFLRRVCAWWWGMVYIYVYATVNCTVRTMADAHKVSLRLCANCKDAGPLADFLEKYRS